MGIPDPNRKIEISLASLVQKVAMAALQEEKLLLEKARDTAMTEGHKCDKEGE